jgi:hypothetical protein
MPVSAETTAQWEKRLRKEQPAHVFFIDDDLREPLRVAAERWQLTVPALIKKIIKMHLNNERVST